MGSFSYSVISILISWNKVTLQIVVDRDEIWEKYKSSIIITIIKLFYTYFSWYIAYYENVFLL